MGQVAISEFQHRLTTFVFCILYYYVFCRYSSSLWLRRFFSTITMSSSAYKVSGLSYGFDNNGRGSILDWGVVNDGKQ